MDTKELRRIVSEARLPVSVDVSRDGDDAYVMHDSATGDLLSFSWARAEVVMTTVNALPAMLDVVEASEALCRARPETDGEHERVVLFQKLEALHAR